MAARLSDTHPKAETVQLEILRAMPPWRKFQLASELTMTVRQLALEGLRERYPGAGPEELRRRLATLLLGPELARKVYGPEPSPPTLL